ncbi:hypothetical protein AB0F17_47635 [Nonomuraea sp. NPDC026600]|uniref:hypothetical protein n=1 Tax=Nonomuraea sp. NPDC026600 TaxID=3155363 RepID=UPI0033CA6F5E
MSRRSFTVLFIAAVTIMTGCSSAPPSKDNRPLGNVTAKPQECGLIARDAIARAIGLKSFYADGTTSAAHFAYCIVTRSPNDSQAAWMLIEVKDPLPYSVQSLEARKASDKGVDLPNELRPGYSAPIRDQDGEPVGAYVSAWTNHDPKLLSIKIFRGAPGRDHQADAIEFARQLKPFLLTSSS